MISRYPILGNLQVASAQIVKVMIGNSDVGASTAQATQKLSHLGITNHSRVSARNNKKLASRLLKTNTMETHRIAQPQTDFRPNYVARQNYIPKATCYQPHLLKIMTASSSTVFQGLHCTEVSDIYLNLPFFYPE